MQGCRIAVWLWDSDDYKSHYFCSFAARRELIKVGDRVRVKSSVTTPKYKWGSVNHGSVGTVVSISPNGKDVKVDFPQQTNWTGLIAEMEVVPATHPRIRWEAWNRRFPSVDENTLKIWPLFSEYLANNLNGAANQHSKVEWLLEVVGVNRGSFKMSTIRPTFISRSD